MVIKGTFADGSPLMAIPNYARYNRNPPVVEAPPPATPPAAAQAGAGQAAGRRPASAAPSGHVDRVDEGGQGTAQAAADAPPVEWRGGEPARCDECLP